MIQRLKVAASSGWALASRNIRIQVQGHALGYAWTLIIPVVYATCYILIKRELTSGADQVSSTEGWDVIRVLGGIMLFQCWIQVVQEMSEMIRRNRGMLRGLNVGPAPFVLAIMFEGLIFLAVRAALIIAAIPVLGLDFPGNLSSWLWFVGSLAILLLSATAIGLFLAPWSVLYGDVRKALQSINLPMVLISPIFYPAVENTSSLLYWVNIINPIASPLAVISDAMRDHPLSLYWLPMLLWGAFSILMILWSVAQLRRQVPILLERIGS